MPNRELRYLPAFGSAAFSRNVVNQHVGRIKRMFKWAAAEELIPAAIPQARIMVAGLRHGRTDARETDPILPVDDATVDATLPHLPSVVADMVRLQRATGMRPSEVCVLRPCDLDSTGDVWTYR
jgi:integrase